MEETLNLTEAMYKEGAGRVNKTDYLDNRVMVETLRAAVALLEKNEEMAKAALVNTMGHSWIDVVAPSDSEVPFTPSPAILEDLVSTAYRFSPD
jgi:outer membrane protein TolC